MVVSSKVDVQQKLGMLGVSKGSKCSSGVLHSRTEGVQGFISERKAAGGSGKYLFWVFWGVGTRTFAFAKIKWGGRGWEEGVKGLTRFDQV
jgi:hypothetical protein